MLFRRIIAAARWCEMDDTTAGLQDLGDSLLTMFNMGILGQFGVGGFADTASQRLTTFIFITCAVASSSRRRIVVVVVVVASSSHCRRRRRVVASHCRRRRRRRRRRRVVAPRRAAPRRAAPRRAQLVWVRPC